MNKRKKAERNTRIVLGLIGLSLLLWCINTIGLYLFGEATTAYDINISHLGTRRDTAVETEFRFNVSYHYMVDGKEYDGLDTGLRGPRLGPDIDGTVHYYPFSPNISSLSAEDALTVGMVIAMLFDIGLIAVAVVPRKKKKISDAIDIAEVLEENNPVTMAWLMEHSEGHDDSVEEYFQNGWDQNDPSWECSCGKWNTENFCEHCGVKRTSN